MKKALKMLRAMLLLFGILGATIYVAPNITMLVTPELVQAQGNSGSSTYTSQPTNFSFTPPPPGLKVTMPLRAYDGSNGTQATWKYAHSSGWGTEDGYFELTAYSPTAGAPRGGIITQVDLSVCFYAGAVYGEANAQYDITYVVAGSAPVLLWGPTQGDNTWKDIKWSNSVEPQDGIWTWEDMSSLRFRFGRTDPGADDTGGTFYIREVWATVHYREPKIYVNPKSQAAQPLTVTINVTDIDELYGFEFKLYYNARVLTATSVSLGPFLNITAGGTANTYGYVVEIDDTLGLVWATQGIKGDRKGGYINGTNGEWGVLATIDFSKDADGNSNFDLETNLAGFNPVPVTFRYGEAVKKAYPIAHTVEKPVHDVNITNVDPTPTGVHQGENVTVNVTVLNEGDYKETFNVTIYAEETAVDSKTVTNLDIGVPQIVALTWNTSGSTGNYTLTAVADTLGPPTESDTGDNTFECSQEIWIGPDVEVSNIVPNATAIYAGDIVQINVTVTNKGPKPITFDLNTFGVHGWKNLAETRESDDAWAITSADGASAKWMAFGGTEAFNTTGWTGVDKVEVGIERQIDKGTDNIIISISNDSAISWSATTYTDTVSETTDTMVWIDFTTAYAWDVSMVNNTAVKLTYEAVGTLDIIKVDYLAIKVTPLPSLTPVEKFPTVGKKVDEDDVAHPVGTPQTVTDLAPNANQTLTFNWDTTGRANSSYIIRANTSEISDEIERANNKFETPTDRKVYIGPDIVVTSMAHNTTVVDAGAIVQINATVENRGKLSATFNVQAWANTTLVGTQTVTDLASLANETLTFNWDTTSAANGTHSIWANATMLIGEFKANDNTRVSGEVYIGPDVAVTGVVPSPAVVDAGTDVSIDVTVKNEGASSAIFDVKVYANQTSTGTVTQVNVTQTVTDLAPDATQVLVFSWDTTSFANDTYVIFANATKLWDEPDTDDNTKIDDSVYIGSDIAVTDVEPKATSVYPGDIVSIDVTVENEGASPVTFDVKTFATPQWTNPAQVKKSDDISAAALADDASTKWMNYPLNMTGWTDVNTVEVGIERRTESGGDDQIVIAVSNDEGKSWSGTTYTDTVTETIDTLVWVDVTSAYAWTHAMVGKIAVRLTYKAVSTPSIIEIDYHAVRVTPSSVPPEVEAAKSQAPAAFVSYLLGTQPVSGMVPGSRVETFSWNTLGYDNATYVIFANATILTGETDTTDNTWFDDTVYLGPDVMASGITYISKTTVYPGEIITIRVKAMNQGAETESFDVKLYANTTLIDTWTVTDLATGIGKSHTFTWNTTGFPRGDYQIREEITRLLGETDTADNTARAIVRVKLLGDINDDGLVDAHDLYILSRAFDSQEGYRSTPRSSNWNAEADLDGDNFIATDELITLINNYSNTG
ncbi:hypothetical protein E3J74_00670 [Candidatus Bathyarchaeota archaeon]|nr:MAG: hypothetical protein E3J74_00670 [Candidatus Bathyarchaeota archaeon]